MDKRMVLKNLRNTLMAIYEDEVDAKRIAYQAGLDLHHIAFGGSTVNCWHKILNEAEKQDKTSALIAEALGEYKANPALLQAAADYHQFLEEGEEAAQTEEMIPLRGETTSAAGHVFICYSHRDQDFVLALARQLRQRGVVVWIDQWDIDPGIDWNDAIDGALRSCTHILVILSPAFVGSLEAKADLRLALDEKKTIVPVLYQPCSVPRQLRLLQYIDFQERPPDDEAALQRLMIRLDEFDKSETATETAEHVEPAPSPSSSGGKFRLLNWWSILRVALLLVMIAMATLNFGPGVLWNRATPTPVAAGSATTKPTVTHTWATPTATSGPQPATMAPSLMMPTFTPFPEPTIHPLAILHHSDTVKLVAFSPDGKFVATASNDTTARLWKPTTGEAVGGVTHEDFLDMLVFSPDGQLVVTASGGGEVRVWVPATREEVAHWHVEGVGNIHDATFSPDGQRLAMVFNDDTARVYTPTTGAEVARFHNAFHSVAFSPDGRLLATADSENSAYLWDLATGEEIGHMKHTHWVLKVTFSPDGQLVATASFDKTARLWQSRTGDEAVLFQHDDVVRDVAFSPNGQIVATASDDGTARLWRTTTGAALARLQHEGAVNVVAFSPNGQMVATASDDGTARLWRTTTGAEVTRLQHKNWVRGVVFSPLQDLLATRTNGYEADDGNEVFLWSIPQPD